MPTIPGSTPGDYTVVGPQGIQALFDIIEQRLEAIEQAVFGATYATQQVNIGSVAIRSNRVHPGPGLSTQSGRASGGSQS